MIENETMTPLLMRRRWAFGLSAGIWAVIIAVVNAHVML